MTFTTKLTLPICKKTAAIHSITNEMHESLQKFLLEGIDDQIEKYFDYILQKCCIVEDNTPVGGLTNIDKFAALCKLKSMSYSSTLKLVNSENVAINIDLEKIIQQLASASIDEHAIAIDNVCFVFNAPSKLNLNKDDTFINSLYSINGLLLNDLNQIQKNKLLSVINSSIVHSISEYIARERTKFKDIDFIPEINSLGFAAIKINPFDSSIFEILKIVYKEDLFSLLKQKYFCITKLNLSCTDYNNLTPADARLFMSFYNEEQAQQNEALKKSNNALSMLNTHEQI
jgi:hypothetical protein